MAVETVVGHDTAQVRVAGEENTKHIVHLTLVPKSSLEQTSDTRDWSGLIGVGLHTNTGVVADAQHVVDNLKTLILRGEVDGRDIGDLGEFGGGVVLEEAHQWDNTGGRDVNDQFVLPYGELLDVFGQTGHDVLAVLVQSIGLVLVLVGRVDDGGAEGTLSCK